MFWLCTERYRETGRVSRVWVEESDVRPDEPEECTEQYSICRDERAPTAHANAHVAYPFNDMGGHVEAGPFDSDIGAWAAFEED